jgi:hypothetical protein
MNKIDLYSCHLGHFWLPAEAIYIDSKSNYKKLHEAKPYEEIKIWSSGSWQNAFRVES